MGIRHRDMQDILNQYSTQMFTAIRSSNTNDVSELQLLMYIGTQYQEASVETYIKYLLGIIRMKNGQYF